MNEQGCESKGTKLEFQDPTIRDSYGKEHYGEVDLVESAHLHGRGSSEPSL